MNFRVGGYASEATLLTMPFCCKQPSLSDIQRTIWFSSIHASRSKLS